MTRLKKIVLSTSICIVMLVTLLVGIVILNSNNRNSTPSSSNQQVTNVNKNNSTITYKPGEVKIQKGGDNLQYQYFPSVNSGDTPTTTAYEYVFKGVMDETTVVNLKSIDTTNVTVSYAYSDTPLDTTGEITGETKFTLQELKIKNAKKYIYILVTPTNQEIPTTFTSSVVWYLGKPKEIVVSNNINNTTTTQTIVNGQSIDENTLDVPEIEMQDIMFEGWYLDKEYTKRVEGEVKPNQQLYAQFSNLPTDWLTLDEESDTYHITKPASNPSTLPSNLVIPSKYNGKPVTEIATATSQANGVFYNQTGLTSVTLPSSLTTIGDYAFFRCGDNLESVDLSKCTSLITIPKYSFYECKGLTNVKLPISIQSLETYAFSNCNALLNIDLTICQNLTTINSAFSNCGGLTNITIPASVTHIDSWAFNNCYNLAEVYNLSNLSITTGSMGYGYVAFYAAIVKNEARDESKLVTIDGVDYYKNSETDYIALRLSDATKISITLDSRTTLIRNYAFRDIDCLTSIDLSKCTNLTTIGNSAFYDCDYLISVELTNCMNLTAIETSAFSKCQKLTNIDLSKCTNLISIGQSAFNDCDKITNIVIPARVTTIGSHAFSSCYALTNVVVDENNNVYDSRNNCNAIIESSTNTLIQGSNTTIIPNDIEIIGNYAFYESGLTSITIPASVTQMGMSVFYDSVKLKSVDLSNCINLTLLNKTFTSSELTSIDLSHCTKLTTLEDNEFYKCSSLESVILPHSITSIGNYVFSDCGRLRSINLNDCISLTSIGNNAFSSCAALSSITIPSKVTKIGSGNFSNCHSLVEVCNLSSLTVTVSSALQIYTSLEECKFTTIDGVRYYKESDNSYIAAYLADRTKTSITLDSRTTSINSYAFYYDKIITSIVIPSNVIKIGQYSFYQSGLSSLKFETSGTWYQCSESQQEAMSGGHPVTITAGTNHYLMFKSSYYSKYWYKK
ncbi:MAG: leucine-rich repeat protein [Clostridia bacterium]|nr:leucine-rich repeat protein [Clostridia bacterium]